MAVSKPIVPKTRITKTASLSQSPHTVCGIHKNKRNDNKNKSKLMRNTIIFLFILLSQC